jgi:hypothetical protein
MRKLLRKFSLLFQRQQHRKISKQHTEIYDTDIFLVSYPKSGSTWLRFLIGNYLTGNKCDFTNHHILLPDIHEGLENDGHAIEPRLIKSHFPFTPEYKKVIYLARDGRDVAVSYYYHLQKYRKIDKDQNFSEFLGSFSSGELGDGFGCWGQHVASWLDSEIANSDSFLLIRYEDLIKDPRVQFSKILSFSGREVIPEQVASAIEASSLVNMKKLEKRQQNVGKHLRASDKSISFVREGKPDSWKGMFSEKDLASFMDANRSPLERLGYV